MALYSEIMQIVTALDWFNNELDQILELYPSEWEQIQKVFIEAKEREKEEIKTIYRNGKDEGYDQSRMERYS